MDSPTEPCEHEHATALLRLSIHPIALRSSADASEAPPACMRRAFATTAQPNEPLDAEALSADSRAHRATGVAPDVTRKVRSRRDEDRAGRQPLSASTGAASDCRRNIERGETSYAPFLRETSVTEGS